MSVSKYRWTEACEGQPCPGDCDLCSNDPEKKNDELISRIELKITGFCKDCPYMDLTVNHLYSGGEIVETEIDCRHVSICSRIWGFVVEKEKELQGVSE